MYSEDDISSAVAAGALSAEAAASFRDHMSQVRALPRQSEEDFKLINSFNDIFVAIGIVILFLAVGAIGQAIGSAIFPPLNWVTFFDEYDGSFEAAQSAYQTQGMISSGLQSALAGLCIAITAWPLAEFFTRKRRMALPSILLLLGFVGGVFASIFGAGATLGLVEERVWGTVIASCTGLVSAIAAYIHWRRFQVPITVAAGAGVAVLSLLIVFLSIFRIDTDQSIFLISVLLAGIAIFAFAMRWDISDRERITRRSDVAFWLHLLAAPLIAHPVFALIGITSGDDVGIGGAIGVIGVYIVFGTLALTIDRRALLVSALAYVLFALTFLFREFGAVELNFALTALVIGSALLSLSAFWQTIRSTVVSALPATLQAKLPETQQAAPVAVPA